MAREALAYDSLGAFFSDLANYGCVSGMVGSLIYRESTHTFFENHYDEIHQIKAEWEASSDETLRIEGEIKNFVSWFAFEVKAYRMVNEWEGI